MATKIGPIQTGEEKHAVFVFEDEGVSGALTSPVVLVTAPYGEDSDPDALKVGDPVVDGLRILQKVKYRTPGVTYLLQCTATDSLGLRHTVSAYLPSGAVA